MQASRRRPQRAAAQRNSKVDFSKCDVRLQLELLKLLPSKTTLMPQTLQNYILQHKMDANIGASREETVEAVSKHFMSQAPPTEEDAIAAFLIALKKRMAREDGKRATRPNAGRRTGA